MKKIFPFLVLLFFANYAVAQYSPEQKLMFNAQYDGQKVVLRWSVNKYKIWQEGNSNGYSLVRYTTHVNDTPLSVIDSRASELILNNNISPLPESQWETQFTNNKFATVAQKVLYEEDATTMLDGNPTLADALNKEESEETRLLFGLFVAEQDIEVAKGLALGFEDLNVQSGYTYLYRLKLNSSQPEYSNIQSMIQVNTNDLPNLPAISEINGEGGDKAAIIQFKTIDVRDKYSTYDIERSTDGSTFTKVNELPFIFGAEGDEEPTYAYYRDSIPSNNLIYHYRVRGRSPFGITGPPSEVITISGIPSRVNLFLSLNDFESTDSYNTLYWETFDDAMENQVKGFNIYKSMFSNESFEKVNTSLLSPSSRSFTDIDPPITGYYILEAIDYNDLNYRSPSLLVQQPDSIPPSIPTGLTGKFITDNKIQLDWEPNTDEDLQGYRLFVANGLNSNFTQITKRATEDLQFIYQIDAKFMVDSIYFKILATDQRENYSEKSEAIAIQRPDIVPPSKPILHKATPTSAGIEIGFKFSSSDDRVNHTLERKRKGTPDWEVILDISKEEEDEYLENLTPDNITSTSFLDTTILERREYQFRMLAYDDDGNLSSSKVIDVRPFDSGLRGAIENFKAVTDCTPTDVIPNQDAFNTLNNILNTYELTGTISIDSLQALVAWNIISSEIFNKLSINISEGGTYFAYEFLQQLVQDNWGDSLISCIGTIELSWDYSADNYLQDFQIFRSTAGSAMMLYKTIPVEGLSEWVFEDEDAIPKQRYFYQIMARHKDGGFSNRSNTIMVKMPAQ